MSAIERCRTAALRGHVARCENTSCGHTEISYNSCGNRHCPKCQGAASRRWLADRAAELLPVPYFHVVYTLPSELRDIAYQNKRVIYNLLMKAAAETTLAIAADPKRLGARIGVTAVLHTWGSALTHHLDLSRLDLVDDIVVACQFCLARLELARDIFIVADQARRKDDSPPSDPLLGRDRAIQRLASPAAPPEGKRGPRR
jgi:Transposase zinc-binding domain